MIDTSRIDKHVIDAIQRLVVQGRRSVDSNNTCQYRGLGGASCMAGLMMKDEFYHASFEGCTATEPRVLRALSTSIGFTLNENEATVLMHLQNCHDYANDEDFVESLIEVLSDRVDMEHLPKIYLDAAIKAKEELVK